MTRIYDFDDDSCFGVKDGNFGVLIAHGFMY